MISRIVSLLACWVIFTIICCKSDENAGSRYKYASCDHIKIVSAKVYPPRDDVGRIVPWRTVIYKCVILGEHYDSNLEYHFVRTNEKLMPPFTYPEPDVNEEDKVFFKLIGKIDTGQNILSIASNPKILIARPSMDTCMIQIQPDSLLNLLEVS